MTRLCLAASISVLGACGGGGGASDSGPADSATPDTGLVMMDSGMADTSTPDAGMDAGPDSGVDSGTTAPTGTGFFNASGGATLTGGGMRLELTIGAPVPAGRSTTPGGGELRLGGQSIR